jgi:hypothetical protein
VAANVVASSLSTIRQRCTDHNARNKASRPDAYSKFPVTVTASPLMLGAHRAVMVEGVTYHNETGAAFAEQSPYFAKNFDLYAQIILDRPF